MMRGVILSTPFRNSLLANMIVDDAVIRSAMEFAASALKLKPDAVRSHVRWRGVMRWSRR
jgi:hypothetical protein